MRNHYVNIYFSWYLLHVKLITIIGQSMKVELAHDAEFNVCLD